MATGAQQRVPERLLGLDFGPEGLARLEAVVEGAAGANRCEIARRACESMGWDKPGWGAPLDERSSGVVKTPSSRFHPITCAS